MKSFEGDRLSASGQIDQLPSPLDERSSEMRTIRAVSHLQSCGDLDLPPKTGPDPLLGSGRKEGRMPRIKYTVEHIITKLREAEVGLSKGQTVVQVSRSLGITEQSCGTNCSMARSSKRVGKPRCSSNA